MGRELRMVPANWEHPKRDNGRYQPLLGGSFSDRLQEWEEGKALWLKGKRNKYGAGIIEIENEYRGDSWEEWEGARPEKEDYMPDWDESERTHFQMYENTSEGSPISPPMKSSEELAQWLVDNNASAFAGMTASYDQWLATIKSGYAPSMVVVNGVMDSGVAALGDQNS
ncbi:MAG: hypothetical protein ACRBF0_19900 [Calditrichia bacterium]